MLWSAILDRKTLAVFVVVLFLMAAIFLSIFIVQGSQSQYGEVVLALIFGVVSAIAAFLSLVSYVLAGRK